MLKVQCSAINHCSISLFLVCVDSATLTVYPSSTLLNCRPVVVYELDRVVRCRVSTLSDYLAKNVKILCR